MATPSVYQQSIPILIRYLKNLSGILTKTVEFADSNGRKYEEFLEFRLAPDMRPLTYQVQSVCNTLKFLAPRLTSLPNTPFPDDETTFPQLQTRISSTISILESIPEDAFNEGASKLVTMNTSSMGVFEADGPTYVFGYTMGNVHFHLATAYCIVRHLGVPIGAFDYLGGMLRRQAVVEGEGKAAEQK